MDRARLELFCASFLMLFVELALIRWTGAWVVHLSYFANFVLLGSFLGIGIGFLRAKKGPDLFAWAAPLLAVFMAAVMVFPAEIDRTGGDLVYFGVEASGTPAWLMLPFIFIATALTMAAIAHGVAVRFARLAPLEAYRFDILGSIAGVVAFAGLALVGFGPLAWGLVIGALFLVLLRRPRVWQVIATAAVVVILAIGTVRGGAIWSPYYRLVLNHANGQTSVDANGVPHQTAIHTDGTFYHLPYQRLATPPQRVLVVGAGNGNDVATALAEGATSVDAVEIDPRLQQVGVDFHPDRPYQDPRVHQIVDDGRAFLERTDDTYDLIVFALPDSLTLVSGQSSVRLESYLFTREAISAAADHLAPGGSFAMYNYYREQWLADRLANTLTDVFGTRPCLDIGNQQGGDIGTMSTFVVSRDPGALACAGVWDPRGREIVAPATDDRPFLYLRSRTIPSRYLVTLALILLVSVAVVWAAGGPLSGVRRYLDLFFMGAAFMLLETKSVVQFALLFGTTWLVNALVFAGVLLVVLLAIEVERRMRIGRPRLLFGLLLVGLLVAALVPTDSLLSLPLGPRFLAAATIAFFPIFVANLIFAERFRDTEDPTIAFGANLLGAMLGGTLEYLSLITGYRALLLLVAIFYGLAYLTTPLRRGRRGAEAPLRAPEGVAAS